MRQQATLGDYWVALYSRKWIILAVTLSSMGFSIWLSSYLPPIYEAKASFYVPSNAQAPSYAGGSPQKLTQTILKPMPEEREAGIAIGVLKSQDLGKRVREQFPGRDPAFFSKNVDFSASPQFFIDIYVRDRDPTFAAAVANAYVEAYRDFHSDKLRESARQSAEVLQKQSTSLAEKLAKKSAAIRDFQLQNRLVSENETEQRYMAQVRDVEHELDGVAVSVEASRAKLGMGAQLPAADGARASSDETVLANPALENLSRLEARRAALSRQLDRLRQGSSGGIGKVAELQTMNTERRTLQEMLTNVDLSLVEARAQGESASAQIVTVQTAEPPKLPGFPIAGLNGAVGLILGFIAGCYNALLLEYLKRLKQERARRKLDDSLLGEVLP